MLNEQLQKSNERKEKMKHEKDSVFRNQTETRSH